MRGEDGKTIMKIGVLDIQGSVKEHAQALQKCGAEVVFVKTVEDLARVDGLIIPGGESTTIGKLLRKFGLRGAIVQRVRKGMPVWGTCAGAILLAKKISGKQRADTLGLMDMEIKRNAYGRQLDSFETEVEFFEDGNDTAGKLVPAVFIRAPKIKSIGKNVKVLAKNGKEIVAIREGNLLATMLHPELTSGLHLHRYFLKMCHRR